jgi:hypothetical protein
MFRQNEASYLKFLLRYSVKIKLGEIPFNQEFENHMKDQDRADVLKHILGKYEEKLLEYTLPNEPIQSFEEALKLFNYIKSVVMENYSIFVEYDNLMSRYKKFNRQ